MGRLVAFGSVLGLAASSGGYFPQSWGWAAGVLAWCAALGLALTRPERPPRLALAFVGGLLALAAWTGLSAAWSQSVPSTVLEVERDVVYVAGVAALLVLGRRGAEDGVLAAAAVVCAWNLGLRLHGYDSSIPGASANPIGYANGLGLLAAIGTLLACRRRVTLPALAVLVPVLVLTQSDGAYLGLAAGAVVWWRPRLAPLVAVGVAAVVLVGLHGHQRAVYWGVATSTAAAHPLLGSGGGTFAQRWVRQRPKDLSTVDAHSLELETLAELGAVGLAILAGTLVLPFAGGGGGAALGAYTAWVVGSGIDWDWELPAVTLAALFCGVAAIEARAGRSLARAPRLAAAAAAVAVALFALVGLVGNRRIGQAEDYRRAADPRALAAARSAARWAPWSADPLRIQFEATGDLAYLRRAIARDPNDWSLWQLLAQRATGPEKRRAAARAALLDPLGAGTAPSG